MADYNMDMTHRWEDPLFLEEQLSEDERMIRDMAHAYCTDKLMPRIISAYQDCLLYTSPSPRDLSTSRMPSSA